MVPAGADDLDVLVALDADPAVMRYVSGGQATPRDVVEHWVLPRARTQENTGRGGLWIATERRGGRFLGWAALRTPRHSPRPEIELSYRLARSAWGNGFATEAAAALVILAFDDLGTGRLFASTTAANIRSRRVMEKIGMRLVAVNYPENESGTPDGNVDLAEVEYELLRAHWEARTVGFGARGGRHRAG